MQTAIASLTSTRDMRAQHLAALQSRLATAKTAMAQRKAAQKAHAAELTQQGEANAEELAFWEAGLGMRIEGTGGEDRIRFVFVGCDGRKKEKEASFELDMSRGYEVVECRPVLDAERVRKVTDRMVESEDLQGFLSGMRRLFVEELKR